VRLGDMRCGIGDVIIGLDIEMKKFDAPWKLARLKVLESGIASFGRPGAQVNMVSASCQQLTGDLKTDAAVCC
jgi:hypothetical protein